MNLGVLIFFVAIVSVYAADSSVIINTPLGSIRGNSDASSKSFLAIPFAKAPVGALRWALPEAVTSYGSSSSGSVPLNATVFGAGCPQNCELPPHTCPEYISEDCLQLNVYMPSSWSAGDELKPVFFYLPGGNFRQGSAGTGLYDSRLFANRTDSVIVVSNYRLGVLGWLVQDGVPPNLGLHDQRMAMRWVQSQIKSFGGDPNKVTIFGQSAGATSVALHLVSKQSDGLFQAAVSQSNPFSLPLKDTRRGKTMSKVFSKKLGCKVGDVACLRAKSVREITAAQKASNNHFFPFHPLLLFNPWAPLVVTEEFPHQPVRLLAEGKGKNIPTIFGTVANEAVLFIYAAFGASGNVSKALYYSFLVDTFNIAAPGIFAKYPAGLRGSTALTMAQLGTDFMFTCATRHAIRGQQKVSKSTYLYKFDHVMSFAKAAWGPKFEFCWNVSCHGQGLAYVFDPEQLQEYGFTFSPEEQAMSDDMESWWTNLGKSGSPNLPGKASIQWPAYDPATEQNMRIMTPSRVQTNLKSDICDFWDGINAYDRVDHNFLEGMLKLLRN